jgi:tetratricopeptide (TPR) repeat protein
LVGWALTASDTYRLVYPEQRQLIVDLLWSEDTCQELTELQIQLIYCLDQEDASRTIQKEIMPDLMRNSSEMIANHIETEEERLEEVLHPEVSEERMERMEATMRRMQDMQKEGIDVFYHGFSQIKRYPFFYDISNWLVPFFHQHPDIAQFVSKQEGLHFLSKVFASNAFCNSDKYSFVIALQEVLNQLPQQIREMLQRGEFSAEELGETVEQSPAYERRIYLMDLYRFFRLYPHREELYNPFDRKNDEMGGCGFFLLELLADTPIEKSKAQIVRQLKKHQMNDAATNLLKTFAESNRDMQYFLWIHDYDHALQLNPKHERAMLGKGRQLYDEGRYEEALTWFDQLTAIYPEKINNQLYVAICLVQLERYEEALKPLFRLNYEQPDNDAVSRVLAWTLTCQGKLEQAANIYEQLVSREQPDSDDLKNYGYCLWLQGQVGKAIELFRQCCQHHEQTPIDKFFDVEWLKKRGITMVDINMMLATL